ncbi:MAG: response regulator [Bacteroidales bacterium]|jgi:DNA-binding response OmpR family regulator|nr:response regulator [Bacteroidales bacterium]
MNTEKKNILIVDDDIDYLNQLELQIKGMGYDVKTANGEKEAVEAMDREKPDLAIIDLMMENKDSGFILCYKMKKRYPSMPIIIASAVTSETGLNFGLETEADKKWIHADKFLEKGIRKDQLEREISKLLKL